MWSAFLSRVETRGPDCRDFHRDICSSEDGAPATAAQGLPHGQCWSLRSQPSPASPRGWWNWARFRGCGVHRRFIWDSAGGLLKETGRCPPEQLRPRRRRLQMPRAGKNSGFKWEPHVEVQADNPHRRGHCFSTRETPLLKPAHRTALSGEQACPRRRQRRPCGRGASPDAGASKGGHEAARLG